MARQEQALFDEMKQVAEAFGCLWLAVIAAIASATQWGWESLDEVPSARDESLTWFLFR